jgi:hypothetical protein
MKRRLSVRTKYNMFDLKQNDLSGDAEAGYEFELVYPATEERTGAFIKVRGKESKIVKAFQRRNWTEQNQRNQINKRKGKETEMSLEESEDLVIQIVINRIIDWRGLGKDGVEIAFSPEAAEGILREHTWIREQILEESDNLLNFRPK